MTSSIQIKKIHHWMLYLFFPYSLSLVNIYSLIILHVLQERGEGSWRVIQHVEEPPGPDKGINLIHFDLFLSLFFFLNIYIYFFINRWGGYNCVRLDLMCWKKQNASKYICQPTLTRTLFLQQTHPDAWPFMEPVKKSEAPDYYEIIRFPIGEHLFDYTAAFILPHYIV